MHLTLLRLCAGHRLDCFAAGAVARAAAGDPSLRLVAEPGSLPAMTDRPVAGRGTLLDETI